MKKFLAVALLALSVPVAAEQTYVIGVEQAAFMPHYSGDAQGNYGGFARELLDSFAAYSGVRLTYKVLPADELLPALLDGRVDASAVLQVLAAQGPPAACAVHDRRAQRDGRAPVHRAGPLRARP